MAVHEPGEFTGDVDVLSGRAAAATETERDYVALRTSSIVGSGNSAGQAIVARRDARGAWTSSDRHAMSGTIPGAIPVDAASSDPWRTQGRAPFLLETSLPGVCAAGDVRSGSFQWCASAVGEGAMAVSFIHASLNVATPAKDVSPACRRFAGAPTDWTHDRKIPSRPAFG
jgi:hypothetical protein